MLTIDDVAERLSISVSTVKRLINDGSLPVVKIRDATRIPLEAVLRLMEHGTTPSDAKAGQDTDAA